MVAGKWTSVGPMCLFVSFFWYVVFLQCSENQPLRHASFFPLFFSFFCTFSFFVSFSISFHLKQEHCNSIKFQTESLRKKLFFFVPKLSNMIQTCSRFNDASTLQGTEQNYVLSSFCLPQQYRRVSLSRNVETL